MYVITFSHGNTFSPGDSQTIFCGDGGGGPATNRNTQPGHVVARPGVLVAASAMYNLGVSVLGSGEFVSFNIDIDNVRTELADDHTLTAIRNTFFSTGLNVPLAAGEEIMPALVTPAWVTNPTNVRMHVAFYIEDDAEGAAEVVQDDAIAAVAAAPGGTLTASEVTVLRNIIANTPGLAGVANTHRGGG